MFSYKILRIFAIEMKKNNNIVKTVEKAIADFYKVDIKEVYSKGKHTYPINGARIAFIWILYSNGIKSYVISEMLGITERQVFKLASWACISMKSETKLKEDIDSINEKLKNK